MASNEIGLHQQIVISNGGSRDAKREKKETGQANCNSHKAVANRGERHTYSKSASSACSPISRRKH